MILAQNYPTSYLRLTACQRAHTSGPVAACDDHVMSEVKFDRGGRYNYFDVLGSIDYFYESNRYFLPITLDPITCQFHCDMGWCAHRVMLTAACHCAFTHGLLYNSIFFFIIIQTSMIHRV